MLVWVVICYAFSVPFSVRVRVLVLRTPACGREKRGGQRERDEERERRGERVRGRESERERGWWTVNPSRTESAFWSPFVPRGSPNLEAGLVRFSVRHGKSKRGGASDAVYNCLACEQRSLPCSRSSVMHWGTDRR